MTTESPGASGPLEDPSQHTDLWSGWLLHYRHADDPAFAQVVRAATESYADRVLDGARLAPGMSLADVGTGEGLIAFRAIDRIGPSLRVLLTDISAPMLRHAETLAVQRGVRHQCHFLHCPAENLHEIADASIDAVTTRAVLAYVQDKSAALREFYRILKPSGRISLAEPIFQDDAFAARALRTVLESRPPGSVNRFLSLLHRWKSAQYPDTEEAIKHSAIANYSERDLIRLAHGCGFVEMHLELHIDVTPSNMPSWDVFVNSSPHPLAPALNVILAQQFTAEERQFFEQTLRPEVESGRATATSRIAYLTAGKPPA